MCRLHFLHSRLGSITAAQLDNRAKSLGARVQLLDSCPQQAPPGLIHLGVLPYLGWPHVGVARYTSVAEPLALCLSRSLQAGPNRLRWLPQAVIGQLVIVYRGYVDVDVDAVEQGSEEALLVAADH